MPLIVWLLLASAAAGGRVEGMAFGPSGEPMAGARLLAGETVLTADTQGRFQGEVEAGSWPSRLQVGDRVVPLPDLVVVEGRTTELLVSLPASGLPVVAAEVPSQPALSQSTTLPPVPVEGRVLDQAGRPLAGVEVIVRGAAGPVSTDADGRWRTEAPPGSLDLTLLASGYASRTVEGVPVGPEGGTLADLTLVEAGLALDLFEVLAPRVEGSTSGLLAERREASVVTETIGAEQMSKAGDSDAAAALRRVTGLTVVGGRYVFVRGLGERYTATLLNGSSLPSPEPERRVVPLDLFPTSMLESVVIQKSPSPDKTGEFGGGIVQIRTRSVPDDPVLMVQVSGGLRTGTTGQTALVGPAGPTDWLGLGADHRAIPALVQDQAGDEALKPAGLFSTAGFDAEELEAFGEAFPNRWVLERRTLPPDSGLQISAGNSVPFFGGRLGGLVGGTWNEGWNYQPAVRRVYASTSDGLALKRRTDFEQATRRVLLGGLATAGVAWKDPDQSVDFTVLLNRVSEAEGLVWLADDPTGSADSKSYRHGWLEQQLSFRQLVGHHDLGRWASLDWRGAWSNALRLEPDRREHTYQKSEEGYFLSQKGTWNEIAYGDLSERGADLGADLRFFLRPDADPSPVLQVGAQRTTRERTSQSRRFSYEWRGIEGIDLEGPASEVFTPENIGAESPEDAGYISINEVTSNSDDYTGRQGVTAVYGMVDTPLVPRLSLLAGARYEAADQVAQTFELFNPAEVPVRARLTTGDVLPSAVATFQLGRGEKQANTLARVAGGRTVSRPELRELSEVPFTDFRSGVLIYGEPELERAFIDHLDLRLEAYPSASESASLALFAKRFTDPIESVTEISAISGLATTFANARAATSAGVEVEGRLSLEHAATSLRDVFVAGNGALVFSRVDLTGSGGNDTSSERPLQGQSPWVANLQVGYDNPDRKISVVVLYNAFGPRIVDVGQSGIPDTYELPVHRLDLVGLVPLAPGWSLRARAANLLDPLVIETTGPRVAEAGRDGRSFSLAVQWRPLEAEPKRREEAPPGDAP